MIDLEVVEVEQQDGARPAAAMAARLGVGDAVGEERAVRELGERVVERLVRELALERLALLDVADREHEAADRRILEQVRQDHLGEEPLAAPPAQPPLERRRRSGTRADLGEHRQGPRLVFRMQEVRETRPVELLRPVAEKPLDRRGLVEDARLGRDDRDDVRGVLDEGAEPRLARAGGGLGGELHVLGDGHVLAHQHREGQRDRAEDDAERGCPLREGRDEERSVAQDHGHVGREAHARALERLDSLERLGLGRGRPRSRRWASALPPKKSHAAIASRSRLVPLL